MFQKPAAGGRGGGGGWQEAMVYGCENSAAPNCLSPLRILTPCGSESSPVVSMEPLDVSPCAEHALLRGGRP